MFWEFQSLAPHAKLLAHPPRELVLKIVRQLHVIFEQILPETSREVDRWKGGEERGREGEGGGQERGGDVR